MTFGVSPVSTAESAEEQRRAEAKDGDPPLPVVRAAMGVDAGRGAGGMPATTLEEPAPPARAGDQLQEGAPGGAGPEAAAGGVGTAPPLEVHLWKNVDEKLTSVQGPGIGEGELGTTHAIIWQASYTGQDAVR